MWAIGVNGTMHVWWVITQVRRIPAAGSKYFTYLHIPFFLPYFCLICTFICLFVCCLECTSSSIALYYKRQHKLSNQFLMINSATSRNAFFTVITTIKSHINLLQQLICFQYIILFSSYTSIISWRETWAWEFPCHETFLKLLQAYPLIAWFLENFYVLDFPKIRKLQSFKLATPEKICL